MVRNWAADRLQYEFSCENIERLASIVIGGVIFGFNIYFSSIMLLAVLLTRKNLLTLYVRHVNYLKPTQCSPMSHAQRIFNSIDQIDDICIK